MTFDGSINLGYVLTIIVIVVGGLGTIFTLRSDVKAMAQRMTGIESEMKKLTDILIMLAAQTQRMNDMDRRITELQHGEGLVLPLFRKAEP